MFLLFGGSMTALAQSDSVVFLPARATVPANAMKLGSIKAGNNATQTNCDYEAVVADAKDQARAMGGNLVKLTELIAPAFVSKCFKIKADVYHVDHMPDYRYKQIGSKNGADLPDHATLYIYRLKDTMLLGTSYHVHLNDDSVICTVKSKSRDSVTIYNEGTIKLWAATEKKAEVPIDVKFGRSYYVRCGLIKGEIRMVPVITIVDNDMGEREYGILKKHDKGNGVKYLQQMH